MGLTAAPQLRRLGVFGGAFDPPHVAHVALALAAVEQLGLDELRVLPTGQAWHKPQQLTEPNHRLAMAQLAFGSLPKVRVDDRELRRSGPTYTIDTLRELRQENPQAQIYLVMGGDQAQALARWRDWADILHNAIISIADRAHLTGDSARLAPEIMAQGQFAPIQMPPMDVSATAIRAHGLTAGGGYPLVPEPVARYIEQHLLYQST